MCMFVFYVVLLITLNVSFGNVYTGNRTDFSKCEVYYARHTSQYKDFFKINQKLSPTNNSLVLDLHFSVLAKSDAHILLAPSNVLEKFDSAYEIVLGAGGNTFCDIRRAQKMKVMSTKSIKGVLSALDVKSFWIHISKDGFVEVGREGEELAFILWKDPDPLAIKWFSFSTWEGVEAKFYYDCPNEIPINATEARENYTEYERLRLDLLSYYDPMVRPVAHEDNYTVVSLRFVSHFISFDMYKCQMEVRGNLEIDWKDEKLQWQPEKYGNVSHLQVYRYEIWKPDLIVFQSVNLGSAVDILGDAIAVVKPNGMVQWNPPISFKVFCSPKDVGYWPDDSHSCKFNIAFWKDVEGTQLKVLNDNNSFLGDHSFENEWKVVEVQMQSTFGWNNTGDQIEVPLLTMMFKIRRNSDVYYKIFFTPFLVISIMILATFCMSPFGYVKFVLGSVQLLLSSLILIGLAQYVPAHPEKVPFFVVLYSSSMVGSLLSMVISTIVINLSRTDHQYSLPFMVGKLLNTPLVRLILLLPTSTKPEEYGNLRDDYAFAKTVSSAQEMWICLGVAIDRISFVAYFSLIIFAYVMQY